jgi:hypothetical protein
MANPSMQRIGWWWKAERLWRAGGCRWVASAQMSTFQDRIRRRRAVTAVCVVELSWDHGSGARDRQRS